MVQVFLLAQGVPAGSWSGNGSGKRSLPRHQQGTGSPGTGSALILCLTTEPGFRVGRPGLSVHRSHMWERINPSASHQAWSEIMLRFGMQIAGVVRNSPTKPIFYWRVYHVTVRNRLPRHRFDRCVPRLWRNRRFLRGSGANPLRRLPHYRACSRSWAAGSEGEGTGRNGGLRFQCNLGRNATESATRQVRHSGQRFRSVGMSKI